jgi:hypothetical protein
MRKLIAAFSDLVQSSFHRSSYLVLYATFPLAIGGRRYDCLGRVHASNMLHEEVFAVEIVGSIRRVGALVAAPEAHAEVLGHGVAFPFVFGVEG